MRHRSENHLALAQRFIAQGEARVRDQKKLIAQLKEAGCPTNEAEALLREYEQTLNQLRNHCDVMDGLMKRDGSS